MATEITMPALAPSMTEGTLSRWIKKLGDEIKVGDVIAEIETDKALVELEATHSGVLTEILVKDGASNVKVDSVIAILMRPGESAGAPVSDAALSAAPQAAMPVVTSPLAVAFIEAIKERAPSGESRLMASPLAKRLANEHGLDLASIKGTGPNGRIVRADVDAALRTAPGNVKQPDSPSVLFSAPIPVPQSNYQEIPHSSMRRVIAQRLTEAKRDIPHFYLTVDCDVDALLVLRQQMNQVLPDDGKISVNDFIVKAVAATLKKVPAANASWTETAVRQYHTIDICVAVSTPGGLITPVVRTADQKSLGTVSTEIRTLAERARQGRLQPQEFQGGGFTISNLGMYGIREFAAIINPPQACILAVGAAEPRPVVKNGAVVAATVMTCTLSADHRVVDGSVGAEFMSAFKALIEKPYAILI